MGAWSKYVKVAAVFERRRLRLKSAVRSVGSWILAGLWLLTIAAWVFELHVARPILVYELPRLVTGIILATAVVYYFVSSHSVVYLRYPHRVRVGRWLEDHKPEIIVGVICALMGVIATRIVERSWK